MKLFRRETDGAESLFRLFTSDLKIKEFDLKIFDKGQIKKHFGKGMYEMWKESLGVLHCRKIIIIFNEREMRVSWPSNNYPDRLVINMARSPEKGLLLRAEKELMELLELDDKELS